LKIAMLPIAGILTVCSKRVKLQVLKGING
jgi:hypothetical protein